MSSTVSVTNRNGIAVIMLDNPPVNALSHDLRETLNEALVAARDDQRLNGIVIGCKGRTFSVGADITEFGKPVKRPTLRDLIATLETIDKPTVAAIHGSALGGGLELALGCHIRVADRRATVGLPEVKLGLLPGAGGTQRLPRLAGPFKALSMIVSGKPVPAPEALETGIVDEITDEDPVEAAVAFAHRKADGKAPLVLIRNRDEKLADARASLPALDEAIAQATRKARGLEAPAICAQSVRNAVTMPFDEALAKELEYFMQLVSSDQSKAQRHIFFAEREAAKVAGVDKAVRPRTIGQVGIIGAGTMGGGIAMSFANAGIPVTILEMNDKAIKRGIEIIEKNYGISVSRGSLSEEAKAKRMSLFTATTDYADLAACDMIIEAVFEEMAIKRDVFSKLDKIAKPGAILASNTSYLDINEIASVTSRPQDVLGTHFFSPANVMRLLEIVRGDKTAPDVLATAITAARRIGKVPVVVGVCHGFVGNRMLGARSEESESLLLEGATPAEVDKAFTDFGWPMGPFQMADLAGLDVGWRNRKSLGKTAAIADPLCEAGRYGQKTGKGYYLYDDGSRIPRPDPEVEKLIAEKAREKAIERRRISAAEIIERTLYPMINEGAHILEEGIAARASDIDIVWVYGYGFPAAKGGPMFWAGKEGLAKIVERLEYWHGKTGKAVFKPAALLKKLAAEGGSFSKVAQQ